MEYLKKLLYIALLIDNKISGYKSTGKETGKTHLCATVQLKCGFCKKSFIMNDFLRNPHRISVPLKFEDLLLIGTRFQIPNSSPEISALSPQDFLRCMYFDCGTCLFVALLHFHALTGTSECNTEWLSLVLVPPL